MKLVNVRALALACRPAGKSACLDRPNKGFHCRQSVHLGTPQTVIPDRNNQ
jgi:hypothetical protein